MLVAGFTTLLATHKISDSYLSARKDSSESKCPGEHSDNKVVIKNDTLSKKHTLAVLCETLTITNLDNKLREIGFGEQNDHRAYDGVSEKLLDKGQSLTIVINRAGKYKLHDHFQYSVRGDFTVIKAEAY